MRTLPSGAVNVTAEALRTEARDVASWVLEFAGPSYGPGGGLKAIAEEDTLTTPSAASALREVATDHPGLDPYRRLALRVQADGGDQATAALLLTAAFVRRLLAVDGLPAAVQADALALGRRQVLSWLAAQAIVVPAAEALAHVVPDQPTWPAAVVAGVLRARAAGLERLDDVHIIARAAPTVWLDGLFLEADGPRRSVQAARILLIESGPRKLSASAVHRDARGARAAEAAAHRAWLEAAYARADLVVCRKSLGDLRDALALRALVIENAPADLWRRLITATGAQPGIGLDDARAGRADLTPNPPRVGGWQLIGEGPGATMLVPVGTRAWKDDAERLLRATGAVLADPRGIPGGGAWQRGAAAALRRAMDAAPGKTPLGLAAIAQAFDDVASHLVRNLGNDPFRTKTIEAGMDAYACVHAAVAGAFEVAAVVLRLDGRFTKRPSAPEALRGGRGAAGSPLGMPGDIPPLM